MKIVSYLIIAILPFYSESFIHSKLRIEVISESEHFLADAAAKVFKSAEITDVNYLVEYFSADFSDNFLKVLNEDSAVIIMKLSESQKVMKKSSSTFVLLKDGASFEKFILPILLSKNYRGIFLILFLSQSSVHEEKIFEAFRKFHVYNVNLLLIDNNGKIHLKSFQPFLEGECRSVRSKVINEYDVNQSAWKNQDLFPKKFKNLHKCPIRLLTFDCPPAVIIRNLDGTEVYSGHDIDLLQEIAKMMNFSLKISILKEPTAWGFIMENGTSGGVMKKVINEETEIGIGLYYLTQTRAKFMSFSEYTNSKIVLVIPPGSPFTAFEKLFSPFSYVAWIAILLTFLFGILTIFIVRQQKQSIQDFVFGSKTNNPYLNMLDIFLNGSQNVEPKRNFSRTLLTIFVLYCIIIRTIFQAGLFQFLQTEQRHREVESVDEIIENKFDVFMYESFQELSRGLKIHHSRKLVGGNDSIEFYQMQTLNPNFKGTTIGPLSDVIYINQQNYKNFTLRVLSEIMFSLPVAMYFPKNHYLANEVDSKISILHSAGIIDRLIENYLVAIPKESSSPGPKKLNFEQLTGAIYIYLAGCCVGTVTFLVETLMRARQSRRKLQKT